MYIDRNGDGKIISVFSRPQRNDHEFVEGATVAEIKSTRQLRHEKMMAGVEFNGVMCSAFREDQWGLASVKPLVESGTDIDFEFENGNVVTLTQANLSSFESVWVPFRMAHTKVNFVP